MNTTSKIYMGDDGNYHDKTEQQRLDEAEIQAAAEQVGGEPVPFDEEGKIDTDQIVSDATGDEATGDGTGEALPPAEEPNPKTAKASTRKQ